MSDGKIYLVGGAGYIGSRLHAHLRQLGLADRIVVIDPGILSRPQAEWDREQDVRTMEVPDLTQEDTVVWLASIHETDDPEAWGAIASKVMAWAPLEWAQECGHFIYVSSMRAVTAPERLYGRVKAEAEADLFQYADVSIVRPGTVWGALDRALPNRTHTAINRLLCGATPFAGEEKFFTTHMSRLLDAFVALIEDEDHPTRGSVFSVTDSTVPYTGDFLCRGGRPHGFHAEPATPELSGGRHPMELYKEYYRVGGVEMPKVALP